MDFGVLNQSQSPIPLHAYAAIFAFFLGAAQFYMRKGTRLHRLMGWLWVLLMLVVCISALWIHQIQMIGLFSPIHLLVPFTLISLFVSIRAAKSGRINAHKRTMTATYVGALLIAGFFTFLPGRIMFDVFFAS